MPDYTLTNLNDVEDMAAKFGYEAGAPASRASPSRRSEPASRW